jgi:hypothetical protein
VRLEVQGAERLAATLDAAAAELTRLAATNRAVASAILGAARPPVRTGRLAASLTATGTDREAVVSSSVRYAPYVERRRGFLEAAARSQQDRAVSLHLEHVDAALGDVKGV